MITKNNKVKIIDLGLKSFLSSWEYQDQLFDSIISVKVSNRKTKKKSLTNNYMVFVEHPAVYTLGKSGKIENLLVDKKVLNENNIKCMVKDDYQNSIIAGWVSPGSENSVRVFVTKQDVEAAKEVIKNARD